MKSSDKNTPEEEPREKEIGTGEESKVEIVVGNSMAIVIHLFLAALAILLIVAAGVGAFQTVIRDFPLLWNPPQNDEYGVLQKIIENLLLIAITAEFGLLLLFRRLSAAVEVVVFVLARKTINPEISALDLLMCAAAIAGLVVLRYYYLPGKTT